MLRNYFLITVKTMMRNKLFTVINLIGISFTLTILVVFTSLLYSIFGPVAPEQKLDRILTVAEALLTSEEGSRVIGNNLSYYFMKNYVKPLKTPELVSISSFAQDKVIFNGDQKIELDLMFTDGEFWDIMDFHFLEGRGYTVAEAADVAHVVVINDATRQKLFNGGSAIGKRITLEGSEYRVIGVVENVQMLRFLVYADVWMPVSQCKENLSKPTLVKDSLMWNARILAKSSSDFPAIQAEFNAVVQSIQDPQGHYDHIYVGASTYFGNLSRLYFQHKKESPGALLATIVLLMIFTMLLPVCNLVTITTTRMMERSAEIGIRKAFGASPFVLIGQFLTENIIVTLLGGFISLIFAECFLVLINESGIIPYSNTHLNVAVFFYSFAIMFFFGVFSGVYPAWKMSRLDSVIALRGGR